MKASELIERVQNGENSRQLFEKPSDQAGLKTATKSLEASVSKLAQSAKAGSPKAKELKNVLAGLAHFVEAGYAEDPVSDSILKHLDLAIRGSIKLKD